MRHDVPARTKDHEERRPRMKMDITISVADQIAAPAGPYLASRCGG
jgi:hypothetical protein